MGNLNPADGISTAAGTDRAVILEDNSEALMERVRMIRNAKERIILSTFDFRADISGKVLLAALLDAAERNVSVKVVVDGVSGLLRMEQNPYFFALSSHPNAEIRIYNRVNPLLPWRLMGRLHDKYLIADETAYILGGRNSIYYFL
ncbi:MAG: phospholipase D family protein, partial [Lachnospiraceae bacterium]|nr:phospholipase D family protein [Lachnospiraceae bacterium]